MSDIPEGYWENKREQAKIKSAVVAAIEVGMKYENILKALSELMTTYIYDAYKEEDGDK